MASRWRFQLEWAKGVPETEWSVYSVAIHALRNAGLKFMLGGGFAFAAFTGRWRDTKDIDFYIEPGDREAAAAVLAKAGFSDYYSRRAYDRKWIYRSTKSGVIVDLIWAMANQRAQVDGSWLARSACLTIRGETLPVLPIEEMVWCKLYVVQRDRCDWTDVFNLLAAVGEQMDWELLVERLGEDVPLLRGLLSVYSWVCPECALKLPWRLWRRLGLKQPPAATRATTRRRAKLLDSRAWFALLQPRHRKLEI